MAPPLPSIATIPPIKSRKMELQQRTIGRQIADPSKLKPQRDPNFPECECLELVNQEWRLRAHLMHLGRNPYEEKTSKSAA